MSSFNCRLPCEAGSRWHHYTFSKLDEGKILTLLPGAANGTVAVLVDGRAVTEIDAQLLAGIPPGISSLELCEVNEGLEETIKVAASATGCSEMLILSQPTVSFASAPIDSFEATSVQEIPYVPSSVVLAEAAVGCTALTEIMKHTDKCAMALLHLLHRPLPN